MKFQVKNISKSFEDNLVLDNISLDLEKGKINSIVGRNGSGKTTLLKIMASIFKGDQGTICLGENSLINNPSLKEKIIFIPDNFNFFSYTPTKKLLDYYKLIYPNFDEDYIYKEAESLGLNLDANIRTHSKGNKTLLGLLIALATNADFILLDEILDGMDVVNKKLIMEYIIDAAGDGRTIILSSHQIEELEGISDIVFYLSMDGNITKVDLEKSEIHKLQIVTKSKLPESLKKDLIIRHQVGRVYLTLFEGDLEAFMPILDQEDIVQYDILETHLEDLFFMEKGKEEKNVRL